MKNFMMDIILPFLRITRDEPTHLSAIVKAIFNVIYYLEDPDYRITFTAEYQWAKPKPILPSYPSEKQECARWKPLFDQWFAQAKPYETTSKDTVMPAKNVDFSTFEPCLLAAIPADGTVFVPNALSLAKLQALGRKYNVIPKITEQDKNNIELKELSSPRA